MTMDMMVAAVINCSLKWQLIWTSTFHRILYSSKHKYNCLRRWGLLHPGSDNDIVCYKWTCGHWWHSFGFTSIKEGQAGTNSSHLTKRLNSNKVLSFPSHTPAQVLRLIISQWTDTEVCFLNLSLSKTAPLLGAT